MRSNARPTPTKTPITFTSKSGVLSNVPDIVDGLVVGGVADGDVVNVLVVEDDAGVVVVTEEHALIVHWQAVTWRN
jgi:hypothetical protein